MMPPKFGKMDSYSDVEPLLTKDQKNIINILTEENEILVQLTGGKVFKIELD
jgi:hypothetical protein